MGRIRICATLFIVWGSLLASSEANAVEAKAKILSVQKIWDAGGHNAFTDLIRFKKCWYCCFREAEGHVKGDGALRVITSENGTDWTAAAFLREEGIDLRDPKLSITPDNRLMMVAGGSIYKGEELTERQPRVSFSSDGVSWTAPQRICQKGDWLWRVTWYDNVAYGVSYSGPVENALNWRLTLVKSEDGIEFTPLTTLRVPGRPNETTLRFTASGDMWALVRREAGSRNAWLGVSPAPYTDWKWNELEKPIGGPNFIQTPDGRWWASGRQYGKQTETVLAELDRKHYRPVLTLPSGGDTSYPGMVWYDNALWISYYSSHEGKTNIYLAKINLTP